jgi:predicted nucleic acid-binding protein
MIFVDTSAWFARFSPDDPQHDLLLEWFASNKTPLITSDYCVDETLTLLSTRGRKTLAIEVGRILFDESVAKLHFVAREEVHRAWILFQSRGVRSGWSFTDCTTKVVMDHLSIRRALALDEHFRQFGVEVVP